MSLQLTFCLRPQTNVQPVRCVDRLRWQQSGLCVNLCANLYPNGSWADKFAIRYGLSDGRLTNTVVALFGTNRRIVCHFFLVFVISASAVSLIRWKRLMI